MDRSERSKEEVKSFHWRRFVSFTAGLSLIGVAMTGIGLVGTPSGRFAYGGGWSWWGLKKGHLLHIHVLLAVLLTVFVLWHLYYNRQVILSYFKDRDRRVPVVAPEFLLSLLVVMFAVMLG